MHISDSGKTIIFVSHNLNSVRRLCKTAILLDKGRLLLKDNVDSVISDIYHLIKKDYLQHTILKRIRIQNL